ncbi:MAG: penicillin-binding protein [Kofleriaceae bacterium]
MSIHDAQTVPAMPQRHTSPGPQRVTRKPATRRATDADADKRQASVRSSAPRLKAKIRPMTPGIPHAARLRAYLAGGLVTLGIIGAASRAWGIQVDEAPHYRALAAKQHALVVDIPAPRGEVLDAQGRALAVSADADSIWANPREIRDVTETAEQLAAILGEDAVGLEAKLSSARRFVWLDRHVTPELARAVREAKLAGIEIAREPRRWYPGGALAGAVIGRSDVDGKGLDGVELAMNDHLTGTRGAGKAVRDARGRKLFAEGMDQPEPGATVKLTLDRSIQAIAESTLETAVVTHQAKNGVVVVLDVATSRVLAMASYPTHDPNSSLPIGGARNRAVTDAFEAGSVMKVFTIAAALDEGAVKPDTEFNVTNRIRVGPKSFGDTYHDTYLTVGGVIKRSSNIGTIQIVQRLGKERLEAALRRFGFGAKTQIELPGEQAGTLRPSARWREIELATMSFGYGLTVTPIQIAAGLAAIGNGGVYRAPRIVDEVIARDGSLAYRGRAEPRQVVKPRTAAAMRTMLASVFEGGKNPGSAAAIVVPGFRSAGKTGTARKWDSAAHQYSTDRYLSSFAGLAPADKPRLAIVVLIDEPTGGDYYGGRVAGPVFATVASESLRYLGVTGETLICPPPVPGENPALQPNLPPKVCTSPAPKPETVGGTPLAGAPGIPTGRKGSTFADAAELAAEPTPAPVVVLVPDFRGMGIKRALDVARADQIQLELAGSGRVVEQRPAAGTPRTAGEPLHVSLRFSDGDSPIVDPGPPTP